MEKLTVRICTGTLCYIMGGAELQLLGEYLPDAIADRVEIRGATCLDFCNREGSGKAPFVRVGEELITEATVAKVVEAIKQQLG
ncbi:MAG: hypothetical protein J1E79_00690 [Rikenella sp.]|nr:hypothetical protein [Rikenella sp.]